VSDVEMFEILLRYWNLWAARNVQAWHCVFNKL